MTAPPAAVADPARALALAYAHGRDRLALAALFALDERLAAIHAAARDPAIGLMRLAWWRDALAALDRAPPPGEPLLRAIAATLLPGVAGGALATLAEGWGALLEGPVDDAALAAHARDRGGWMFALAAGMLGRPGFADAARAGEVWALVDLGTAAALAAARARIGGGRGERWPVALRPLGMLAALAAAEARGRAGGAPARLLRMVAHRLTGHAGLGAPPPAP